MIIRPIKTAATNRPPDRFLQKFRISELTNISFVQQVTGCVRKRRFPDSENGISEKMTDEKQNV
jgi:hypothetical protein